MERPTCSTCAYWWDHENDGYCCRHPPQLNIEMARNDDAHARACDEHVELQQGYWPNTPPHAFCGEHPLFSAYLESLNQR
jgi:hypothetical protein